MAVTQSNIASKFVGANCSISFVFKRFFYQTKFNSESRSAVIEKRSSIDKVFSNAFEKQASKTSTSLSTSETFHYE